MRLTAAQREAIETAFRETFHPGSRLVLFGSRTDDSLRGGDIDLCVETPPEPWDALLGLRRAFETRLLRSLGDRRVDIVMRRRGDAPRPVDAEIDRKGIALCWIPV